MTRIYSLSLGLFSHPGLGRGGVQTPTLRLLNDFHNDDDMLELCGVSDHALTILTNDKGTVFAE